jgi:hypothetical protein
VRQVDDPFNLLTFCAQVKAALSFSLEECSNGAEGVVVEGANGDKTIYWYAAQTHDLIAVVQHPSTSPVCVAGPTTLVLNSSCADLNMGFGCNLGDAGPRDAASDSLPE